MEICFVTDNNYKRFLKDNYSEKISQIGKGDIIDETGEVVGKHPGYINYTIGQRKGLGLSNPEPRYVSKIDPISLQINNILTQQFYDVEVLPVYIVRKNLIITY